LTVLQKLKDVFNQFAKLVDFDSKKTWIGFKSSQPSVFGPGFLSPPGGIGYLDRTVLSWHYYCWALGQSSRVKADQPYDPQTQRLCDEILGKKCLSMRINQLIFAGPTEFDTVEMRAKELAQNSGRSGSMLTEFGLCKPDIDKPDTMSTIECEVK